MERLFDQAGGLTKEVVTDADRTTTLSQAEYTPTSFGAFSEVRRLLELGPDGQPGRVQHTTYHYDGAGQLREVRRNDGGGGPETILYRRTFEAETGRLATVMDGFGNLTRYRYTTGKPLPERVETTEVGTGLTLTTRLTYDSLGRMIGQATDGGAAVSWQLDEAGNALAVLAGGPRRETDLDCLGRRPARCWGGAGRTGRPRCLWYRSCACRSRSRRRSSRSRG